MTKQYDVSANGFVLGRYEATSSSHALDLCAVDAGYKNVADLAAQIERASELVAVACHE